MGSPHRQTNGFDNHTLSAVLIKPKKGKRNSGEQDEHKVPGGKAEFEQMTKDELIAYISERFSTDPEYPWDDENFIFRHQNNRKWFAVAMRVPYQRLGINCEGVVDIVDVKCGPLLMDVYRRQSGILPGYHMNKDHWITILLDGTADDGLIKELFEISYDLTNSRTKSAHSRDIND